MRIPVLKGTIKRRLLVNFRVDPELTQRLLPSPFRPKQHRGNAIVGICLIRLEHIRPAAFPRFLGFSSENAAHRIAVEWTDASGEMKEGVFISRRDSGSRLNALAGGRLFPGEHHHARFAVTDQRGSIDLKMEADDGQVSLHVVGTSSDALPSTSCFESLSEASAFFEGGCLGYSVTRDKSRFDGMLLRIQKWHVKALDVTRAQSSYFHDVKRFPSGTLEFDHALVMRDIAHEWHQSEEMYAMAPCV